ncbi:PREDICTED: actin [Myotis davidii]|uniref:actin n=1 Tax=Myotis davidii TaxID=225400 RepID=UPI0003EC358F|nr:PREDICTED: actin [Myotis davidii]
MSVPIICDFGSGSSKVGFAGAKVPLAVFPTVLGKFRHLRDDLMVGLDRKVWFIGDEVQEQQEKLNLVYPLSRATVTNWDHMEKILFETFNVPALYLVNQGVLSLFSSGLTSGTIIESGDGMTHFVPIIEGYPLRQSTMQMEVAGQDITLYLMQLLSQKGNSLVGIGDREYIRDLKEKCCYVALNFDKEKAAAPLLTRAWTHQLPDGREIDLGQEMFLCMEVLFQPDLIGDREYIRDLKEKCCYVALNFDKEKAAAPLLTRAWTHQLPDGREIDLGQEMFLCMEVLFQPDLIGRNSLGAHMIAFRSVSSCSTRQQRTLFGSVLLSGGTGVSTCPCSVYSAWMGGSVLCSLSTFKDMWVSSDDYKEEGPSAVSRKSF